MSCPTGLTAMVLATAFSAADVPNLVPNGSFEDADGQGQAVDWTAETVGMRTVAFTRDETICRTGKASVRVTVTGESKPSWPAYAARLPVQPGQCYRVGVWIRTADVERCAYVATDYLGAEGKRVAFSSSGQVKGTQSDWTHVSLLARVPEGTVSMSVRLILYGNGTAWFDEVTVGRDGDHERVLARLSEPLSGELVTRGTTAQGDLARVHRLFDAAVKGGRYTVGIIGGSITAGAAASSRGMHYSAYVLKWLREHFPAAEWGFVNAGIGATGSNYGCLRAQRDLLSRKPDLVVTEYGVNDGNTRECAETYEGLLRQILTSRRQPPVLMLFMMNQAGGNAQEWQSKLGRHYALPMLSYRDMLWPEIEGGRMTWRDISPDEVHPNDVGHAYAGRLLTSLLDVALATPQKDGGPAAGGPLPGPLLTDVYQSTRLLEAKGLKPTENSGWAYEEKGRPTYSWLASIPGSAIEFELAGEIFFVAYWRIRGPMGRARMTIDGQEPTVQDAWFAPTWGGYRHMVRVTAKAPGMHRIRLELLPEKHPESTGTEFRLLSIGAAGK
ncbi:MAG: SGNH/GDSL hydrolase family protein [Lentisphaerae bacterium]|jgi:lysophospholipase L1-like esterase|nr:SGNH/GDSL hydrolase family protein [Lentisphaerota bacterium]MBT5612949.1 SGNH/GDSL hydrolase family protein [Lentisphaerota bacterium]MBT7059027.1 SGNH/GDSL hydrolase family protein [Lentisphaerota bacterium]MBT7846414.1 SGNH/GDSL hydrolase family protein [Lentisphaerota bacterium]